MIDVAYLTLDEREELRRALVHYRNKLESVQSRNPGSVSEKDATWRLYVVRTMLEAVNPQ